MGMAPDGAVVTDRGEVRAPLVVDALGWRRVLSRDPAIQPPQARLSRGSRSIRTARARARAVARPRYVRAGYSWSFPAAGEMRVGCGSFEPRDHVKEPTVALARELGLDAVRFQGNWIPHQLREATADGVFFVGDSAGHCLPLTAEGIRPAFYFALALGATLREVIAGRLDARGGARRLRRVQRRAPPEVREHARGPAPRRAADGLRPDGGGGATVSRPRLAHWIFARYLEITPAPERRRTATRPRPAARCR